jgi:tRNA acetyltransferase TAN1
MDKSQAPEPYSGYDERRRLGAPTGAMKTSQTNTDPTQHIQIIDSIILLFGKKSQTLEKRKLKGMVDWGSIIIVFEKALGASTNRNKLRRTKPKLRCRKLLSDFNMLASTMRGNERQMCYELAFLLKEAGDAEPKADKTGIRGLVVAKTSLDPVLAVEKFKELLLAKPYEFRYSLRIIPIQKVVPTELEAVKSAALELASKLGENESFRVTVEKRFTNIHSRDLIEAVATEVKNKVNLENPDKILLIEVLGAYTGVALLKPTDIISVFKEKML